MKALAVPLNQADPADFSSYCQSARHNGERVGASWAVAIAETSPEDRWGDETWSACTECVELMEEIAGFTLRIPGVELPEVDSDDDLFPGEFLNVIQGTPEGIREIGRLFSDALGMDGEGT